MLQVFKIQAAGFMSKIAFAGSSLSCVHLRSWRRQSGDHESSPVESSHVDWANVSVSVRRSNIFSELGSAFLRITGRPAISTLGRATFIILVILVSFCTTPTLHQLSSLPARKGTSEPENLKKMQLKSSSRSGIKDNTGLTGRSGDAMMSGDTTCNQRCRFTSQTPSSRGVKNKPQRRPNKPPGYSGRPGRPLLILKVCRSSGGGGGGG